MSALTFSLLFFICGCCYFVNINGIQNLRYPTRLENNQWRFGKRQDLLSQPRIFLWKPALMPGQMYPNAKTPVIPLNYNRYGLPPAMAPIHQSYMFAIPTKINYTPYQPVKEIDESRKPGNLHHITIINAIIPKPYMPTAPTYTHPTTTFRNYRSNNKLLHHQYFNNNYGRQNMENLNKLNSQQMQLQQQLQKQQKMQQQQQSVVYKNLQNSIPAATLALMVNKPTLEYMNLINYSTTSNNREHKINNTTTTSIMPQCGRKTKDDSSSSASKILYYYCNNRILNYKNPSEYYKESSLSIPTTTPKTTTTTTTKSLRSDLDYYTTEKSIFLPTPNTPPESSSFSAILTTTRNPYEYEYNFVPAKSRYNTRYVDVKLQQPQTSTHEDIKQQSTTKYDDLKRKQQHYTTTVYDDMKLHSFFTIEDAVTSAPQMQVFNDPYQAYRHARKHHNHHQRRTTTTKKPIVITTTKKSILKSFFDDLENEDYVTSDAQQYDYKFFGQPQKSAYRKPEIKNDLKLPKRNKILDHSYKPDIEDSLYGESHQGKPKIKEHHFDIFEAITPTSYIAPPITTYKPYENFKDNSVTTQKSFHSSHKPITLTYATTTTEMRIRNEESETTTPDVHSNLRLSTTFATSTTTEKKPKKIYMKTPLNLRSTSTFKYPKQRGLYKPFQNLTSFTSSTAATPLKKAVKYQRQYKSKQLKQFKHLFTTTTTTTSTTTTVPTTEEYDTKKVPLRTFATTSTTEATTTRKLVPRTSLTTEAPNTRRKSARFSSTTEANNAKTLLPPSSPTTEANTTYKDSTRRGSKRANNNKPKEKEDFPVSTSKRTQNKSRRRHQIISTTPKTPLKSIHSYSTYSSILPTSSRKFSTTTTMKSIMRISNSKSRPKAQNDIKPYSKNSNEVYDDISYTDDKASLKSTITKDVSVPPLPIEIYFRKSHNAKIYNANK